MHTRNDNIGTVRTIVKDGDAARYAAEIAAFVRDQKDADRLRDMRALGFGQRTGLCG